MKPGNPMSHMKLRRYNMKTKVIAEITVSHLTAFAAELGCSLAQNEALEMLNRNGMAQELWTRMMHAAEDYTKALVRRPSARDLAPKDRETTV
jgi:hypothetical protein